MSQNLIVLQVFNNLNVLKKYVLYEYNSTSGIVTLQFMSKYYTYFLQKFYNKLINLQKK